MKWQRALNWLGTDTRDDFFPDLLRFKDISKNAETYCEVNRHRLTHYNTESFEMLLVPKSNMLKRDAVSLSLPFRVLYNAIFAELFPVIAPHLSPQCYSYRIYDPNRDDGDYPFPSKHTSEAWNRFNNDFRKALGEDKKRWGVTTDLTNFYEHINIRDLVGVLRLLIPSQDRQSLSPILQLMQKALEYVSRGGFGIPQNYDASSFFGSAFLTPVDRAMCSIRGLQYFRWVDDIRIVTDSRAEVIDAITSLQNEAQKLGMFLNSAKTQIIEPDSKDFHRAMDASHDSRLRDYEHAIASCHEATIRSQIPKMLKDLEEAELSNNDRMVRAYGSKILDAAQFVEVRSDCLAPLADIALRQLKSRPGRADWWYRFLVPDLTSNLVSELLQILRNDDTNRFEWTNMYIVMALIRARDGLPGELIDLLREFAFGQHCFPLRAWAIVCLGRHSDDINRLRIANDFLTDSSKPFLVRAALTAIQEVGYSKERSVL
jgi:hypothetical protein